MIESLKTNILLFCKSLPGYLLTSKISKIDELHLPLTRVCFCFLAHTEICWHNVPPWQRLSRPLYWKMEKSDLGSGGLRLAHLNVPFREEYVAMPSLKIHALAKFNLSSQFSGIGHFCQPFSPSK